MLFYEYVLFISLFAFSKCHVLISSFDENDIGFISNAADFLLAKGIKCSVLIPNSIQDLILFDNKVKVIAFKTTNENVNLIEEEWSNPVPSAEVDRQLTTCKYLVREKEIFDQLLKDPPTTVIFPSFLHDACLLPFFDHLNSQAVQFSKNKGITTLVWTSNYLSDSWAYFHVTSSLMPTIDAGTGTFSRVKNFVNWWLFLRQVGGHYVEPAEEIISSNLQFNYYVEGHHKTLPDLYENRVNLTLVATHPLFTPPTHLSLGVSPITVNIGCFNCRAANDLSKDLEEHIVKYKSGVVLVDLDFKSNIPMNVRGAVIEASKSLPFSVIWQTSAWAKSGQELPNNMSESLFIGKRLPLQDILGHPKCRIFVSRCSMESVLISTYHGVPLICLPVTHFDASVASFVEKHGIGVILPRRNITGKLLFNAISGVANDLSFRGIARHLAETLRDQPETPGDRFIYAIESLERHRGHNHYSNLKKQNFFSAHYWDICVALTLSATVIILFASFIMWCLYCRYSDTEQIVIVDNKKMI